MDDLGDEGTDAPIVPARPVAVLDANVLIPAGLRDLMLSCADVGVFRPVWQAEIEDEVVRNTARLTVKRHGIELDVARASAEATVTQMRRAFPDACAATELWTPLVGQMTCDHKDRHVLAVAVGVGATHLVTTNIRDFPVRSRPAGVAVVKPDRFLRDRLAAEPDLVVAAVEGMSARLKHPPQPPAEIARLLAKGQFTPKFGAELLELLEGQPASR
jgi:predicted nucleic acid-binding protein